MSKIKNGALDRYGKVYSFNGIGDERVKHPISQSLSIHSHLSLAQYHFLEFDHSVFDSDELTSPKGWPKSWHHFCTP